MRHWDVTRRKKQSATESSDILNIKNSNYSFRSSDLGVMSPARYPCAKLLYEGGGIEEYDLNSKALCRNQTSPAQIRHAIVEWYFIRVFLSLQQRFQCTNGSDMGLRRIGNCGLFGACYNPILGAMPINRRAETRAGS